MLGPKALGLVAAVALAVSAAVAPTASATEYNSEAFTTFLTAVQESTHVFTGTVKVECTGATGQGEYTKGATSLTLQSIAYSGCKLAGQAATVNMNGCDYKLGSTAGSGPTFTIKTITIECPAGKQIEITSPTAGCTIKYASQTTTGSTTITNNAGPPRFETVALNITGISYTQNGGICKPSEDKDGSYTGTFKITGYFDAAHKNSVGIFVT